MQIGVHFLDLLFVSLRFQIRFGVSFELKKDIRMAIVEKDVVES